LVLDDVTERLWAWRRYPACKSTHACSVAREYLIESECRRAVEDIGVTIVDIVELIRSHMANEKGRRMDRLLFLARDSGSGSIGAAPVHLGRIAHSGKDLGGRCWGLGANAKTVAL